MLPEDPKSESTCWNDVLNVVLKTINRLSNSLVETRRARPNAETVADEFPPAVFRKVTGDNPCPGAELGCRSVLEQEPPHN